MSDKKTTGLFLQEIQKESGRKEVGKSGAFNFDSILQISGKKGISKTKKFKYSNINKKRF